MIANVKSTEGIGDSTRKKGIHAGSESIMFSVLQETQYMYPFKSSVREIVSNCLDSITERNNSLKILSGELKEEDLYIKKEGSEFSGSSFNPEYYSEKWLSDNDMVTILYIDNDTATRDRIKFIDEGVGLGGARLINYFDLGYSTKRLSTNQLGSFGLGAKSLLSTGVDFYTVTSRYNGREYSFNIFKDHVASAIDKFEDDGTINDIEVFFEGTDQEYRCYYRNTKLKNGVTAEAEVKRHRKMDFINSIENQLGFIKNIQLLMKDAHLDYLEPNKRDISNKVLFSTPKILVGESDYYAVPQILLKPGPDSDVMISYGTINFEELEMKKYSGNVSFIMNINEVDVTPSRENVIWNTRTRDAIKNMFLTAQETVTDLIEDKIKGEENLPDFLTLLANFRNKNAISGIAELYKIIDISKIENAYRKFNIGQASVQLNDDTMKKDFIFTSTERISSWGTARFQDTSYNNALSKEYISHLSPKNSNNEVVVYIGETKIGGIARYVADTFSIDEQKIEVIYIRESLYEQVEKDIKTAGGMEMYMDDAYRRGNWKNVLLGEVYRYSKAAYAKVITEGKIDKSKLTKLAKMEEEAHSHRYMNAAEKARLAGKVIGNKHSTTRSTYRNYYDESMLEGSGAIIYPLSDETFQTMFRKSNGRLADDVEVIGFSSDNFKRFYKLPGVKMLSNELYKIEFGDLSFTPLGEVFLDSSTQLGLTDLYRKNIKTSVDFSYTAFRYLQRTFADFKIKSSTFNAKIEKTVSRINDKKENYLRVQSKEREEASKIN
jgi:hypothetical protein